MPNSMTGINRNYTGSIPATMNNTGRTFVATVVLVLSRVKVVFIRHLVLAAPTSHNDRGLKLLNVSIIREKITPNSRNMKLFPAKGVC